MYKLVKFSDWYADDIYLQGFSVMSEKLYTDFSNLLIEVGKVAKKENTRIRLGVADGYITYKNVDELLEQLEVIDVSNSEAKNIVHFFGNEYGWFPWEPLLNWLDWFEEESGEEE